MISLHRPAIRNEIARNGITCLVLLGVLAVLTYALSSGRWSVVAGNALVALWAARGLFRAFAGTHSVECQPTQSEREFTAAGERSIALLREHLKPNQLETWDRDRQFYVDTPKGSRYLIVKARQGNVFLIDKYTGMRSFQFCLVPGQEEMGEVRPDLDWPIGDVLLLQLLMLQCEEDRFIQSARQLG